MEAPKSDGTASVPSPNTSDDGENLDPRAKMVKEIQAMLGAYETSPTQGGRPPVNGGQDNLSSELKNGFCTWGGMLYATSIDGIRSASRTLTQRVEAMSAEEQRVVDEVAAAHEDFAYPLGASLTQQEKSGVPTGDATTLSDVVEAFQQQLKDAARELNVLWGDWGRSQDEVASSAKALAAGGLGASEECGKMSGDFDEFVQGELESFRRTCDADLEKMEILEQEFKEQLQDQISDYLKCLVADF